MGDVVTPAPAPREVHNQPVGSSDGSSWDSNTVQHCWRRPPNSGSESSHTAQQHEATCGKTDEGSVAGKQDQSKIAAGKQDQSNTAAGKQDPSKIAAPRGDSSVSKSDQPVSASSDQSPQAKLPNDTSGRITSGSAAGGTVDRLPPEFGTCTVVDAGEDSQGKKKVALQINVADNNVNHELRDFCYAPIPSLPLPAGLEEAKTELNQGNGSVADQTGLGIQGGTVEAVYGLGNGAISLVNGIVSQPLRLGNFLASAITNPGLAQQDGANWGSDTGRALCTAIKVVLVADSYLYDVSKAEWHGDFGKVFRDGANQLHKLGDHFGSLNPGQQAEFVTNEAVTWLTPVAAGKAIAATSFAAQMEAKSAAFLAKSDAVRKKYGLVNDAEEATATKGAIADLSAADSSASNALELHKEGEKQFAGAYRFYNEINSSRNADIPIQIHKNACVAAVGELLTEGRIDQRSFVDRLEQYLIPQQRGKEAFLSLQDLSTELGPDWQFETVSPRRGIEPEPLLEKLLSRRSPFGVTFKEAGSIAHAVVVDGINEAGRLMIRDPGDGTMYEMEKKDFLYYWSGQAVANRVP